MYPSCIIKGVRECDSLVYALLKNVSVQLYACTRPIAKGFSFVFSCEHHTVIALACDSALVTLSFTFLHFWHCKKFLKWCRDLHRHCLQGAYIK